MGFPSPASDYIEQRLTISSHVFLNPSSTYIMVCASDYPDVGILKGSLLAVDRSIDPKHGHVVVAIDNGEFIMRRFLERPALALQELGGAHRVHRMKGEFDFLGDDSPVWGVVAYVVTDAAGLGFRQLAD